MLISALSFLVVAQSSSEFPEGLMNNPVYKILHKDTLHNRAYLLYELKVKLYHCRPGQAVMAPGE